LSDIETINTELALADLGSLAEGAVGAFIPQR